MKTDNTDKSVLVKETDEADKKIPGLSGLVKKDYNAKITEIEGKISSINGLRGGETFCFLLVSY